MLTIELLRNDLFSALKSGNKTKLDILRFLVSECEYNQKLTPMKIIKKVIESNNVCLQHSDDPRLKQQNAILSEYVAVELSPEKLEAEFLNSDGPELELIKGANNEGVAIGLAMRFVKQHQLVVANSTVIDFVKKLRQIVSETNNV